MTVIDKISEKIYADSDKTFQNLKRISLIKTVIISLLIVGYTYTFFFGVTTYKNKTKDFQKKIDSLKNENDILLYEIVVNQEKVKQSEEKIQLLEKNFQQSLGKLQQIQNQYQHEKNNPVPHDQRPDAIRKIAIE